jgi:hypothetical protein
MSEGKNMWRDDGAPRRPHPACPFCGEDEIGSHFDKAWCCACSWKGTLTDLLELELRRRPGARLLEFLETREIPLGRFATDIGVDPANIRRYTNPPKSADAKGRDKEGKPAIKWPKTKMVLRWATYLDVEVGSFYRRSKE